MAGLTPVLDAYFEGRQQPQQEQLGQLQRAQTLMGILSAHQQQQQRQAALMREQQLRGILSQLPPDASQEQVMQAVRPFAGADDLLRSATASADRGAALKAAQENRAAQMEQARTLQTERLQAQATLAQQRSEDMQLSQADRNQARLDAIRLAASLRPPPQPPQVQPLVPVINPATGQPELRERKDAVGMTPAGAGSKAEAVAAGKTDVDKDVITLKSALDQLNQGGGITSTEKGVVPNVARWASNTGPGQLLGSMGGTHNQKARDVISQARPLLLRSIMQASGMSAKQLDSNAELKLWLSTATDPTKGYEANLEALNNIASKYGSGAIMDRPQNAQGTIKPSRRSDDVPAGMDPKIWGAMTPDEKRLFK